MLSNKTIARLNEIAALEDNWNGYGAQALSNSVIDNTRTVLSYLNFDTQIYPTGRNSIQLEYGDDKDRIELEVFEDQAQYDVVKNYDYVLCDEPVTIEDCVAILNDFSVQNKK
jgi:hypothetical protein